MCEWEPLQEPVVQLGPTAQGGSAEVGLDSAAGGYHRNLTDFWTKQAKKTMWV